MIVSSNIALAEKVLVLVLAAFALCFFNADYFLFSFQILLGLLAFPFLVQANTEQKRQVRYGLIALFFLLLATVLHLQILLFFAWACLLVFLLEWYIGSMGYLPLFLMGAISPALFYVVNIFSFPLRLELSEITCKAFQFAGLMVENKGSFFLLPDGSSFHVDEACVGLKMFGTGYISALLVLGYWEKRRKVKWAFWQLLLAMAAITLLLVCSNLIRLFALVLFKSMPNTASHEAIGLLSLLVYAVLPFYFIVQYLSGYSKSLRFEPITYSGRFKPYLPVVLLLIFTVASFYFKAARIESRRDVFLENLTLPGFEKQAKEDGVMQFKNAQLLVYIKPAIRAFEGGHPPHICWKASGFELCDFSERKWGKSSFMFGTLKQGNHIQYTAWWYDNGGVQTVHEWEWRKRNETPFRVVNMNALDSAFLLQHVSQWMEHKSVLR